MYPRFNHRRLYQNQHYRQLSACLSRALLVFLALSLTPLAGSEKQSILNLEDIFNSQIFKVKEPEKGKWADGCFWYLEKDSINAKNNLIRFDPTSSESEIIINGNSLFAPDHDSLLTLQDFLIGNSGRYVLLFTDTKLLWRMNTLGFYYLFDLRSGKIFPVSDRSEGHQMFAKLSPDDRQIGFVRKANLYLLDIRSQSESQLTTDGIDPDLLNGISDWVYEEEFQLRDGWQWSPDSRFLAFYQFDTTPVPEFIMTDARLMLPQNIVLRYPQAGRDNSNVRIGIIDIVNRTIRFIQTGTWKGEKSEFEYIPRIGWTPTNQLWAIRLNRHQNHLELLNCDPVTLQTRVILEEKSDTWIESASFFDMGQRIFYFRDGKYFLWASDRDGYNHLYLYQADGKLIRQLTTGEFDILKSEGLNNTESVLYFSASIENPTDKHLYRILIHTQSEPERVTLESGTHKCLVSPDGRYFYASRSTIESPPECGIFDTESRLISMIEDNRQLADRLQDYEQPIWTFDTLKARDGTILYSYMITPHDFDPGRRYPLLIYTYGGPTAQIVTNSWKGERGLWHNFLTSELPVIIAGLDNRGTINRGKDFLAVNYLNLGSVEPQDQIEAAKRWSQLPYIDPDRIGIWGWSYGGTNTLLAMSKFDGPQIFKTGIAVAPVTSWELYDTIYTERYLGTPRDNPDGYFSASPVNFIHSLRPDQNLLLIHGVLDDNVHYQNTVKIIDTLQRANILFHLMTYPGANHSMGRTGNPNTKLHLYKLMTAFLKEYL